MAEPFIAEIRIFSFNFAPTGWAQCNGQLLQISQNQALFAVISNNYGGDGKSTFALPNLQGRVAIAFGAGAPALYSSGGEETHVLTIAEIPSHSHEAAGSSATASLRSPGGNTWATSPAPYLDFGSTTNTTMAPTALQTAGGSAAHDNMQPYLVLNYCIALEGIFPPRN